MNTIKNKLRSRNGASLMLALLFLLFCILVGGTILAAASANGFRVTRVSDKKQELQNSSAARLIADQLDGAFSLEIDTTESPVKATLTGEYSAMRRLIAEMALCKYMKENSLTDATLVCNGTNIAKTSFWYQQGTSEEFVCTMKLSSSGLVDQEVVVSMSGYTVSVDLGDGSSVSVQMKGNLAESDGVSISWNEPQIKKEG